MYIIHFISHSAHTCVKDTHIITTLFSLSKSLSDVSNYGNYLAQGSIIFLRSFMTLNFAIGQKDCQGEKPVV